MVKGAPETVLPLCGMDARMSEVEAGVSDADAAQLSAWAAAHPGAPLSVKADARLEATPTVRIEVARADAGAGDVDRAEQPGQAAAVVKLGVHVGALRDLLQIAGRAFPALFTAGLQARRAAKRPVRSWCCRATCRSFPRRPCDGW